MRRLKSCICVLTIRIRKYVEELYIYIEELYTYIKELYISNNTVVPRDLIRRGTKSCGVLHPAEQCLAGYQTLNKFQISTDEMRGR
jgi:hypothetical protein